MSIVNTIKGFAGYLWVVGVIIITAIAFTNIDYFNQRLIVDNGVHVSENWTGGDIKTSISHNSYKTNIHEPVLRGVDLFRQKGFVQIDWQSDVNLPDKIYENIDYNTDGKIDFEAYIDTINNTAAITPFDNRTFYLSKEKLLVYKNSRTIRVLFVDNQR